MIDIHCHILPAIDDGAKSWDIALQMCAMAWNDGITQTVATPHSNEVYQYDRATFAEVVQKLNNATGNKPEVGLGCDFNFNYENIQDLMKEPGRFTIATTPYLLVEFSDFSIPPSVEENLDRLMNIGLKPIITHPERNPLLQRTPQRVLDWVNRGCLVQVTANSLTGRWGKKAESMVHWLFDHEAIHILATDAHNLDSRPPILSEAREKARAIAGDAIAEALVNLNPRAIVAGENVPSFPHFSSR
jgi:protein-tyrosine phosphatase